VHRKSAKNDVQFYFANGELVENFCKLAAEHRR
jgi:hypothetical protein